MGKVTVIGSSNTDMVVKSARIPVPGETILGGRFLMNPGGKGANQAVAAARMGAEVTFIAKVGDDLFGKESRAAWQKEKIVTDHVFTDPENPSGVALIMVDEKAENCISVASGANGTLSPAEIDLAKDPVQNTDIVLMQLETPVETVLHAAELASANGVRVILNPAPAAALPDEIFPKLFLITPNETEAQLLTGIRVTDAVSAREAAERFIAKGVRAVIITMGSRGAYYYFDGEDGIVPAQKVQSVDTTAAGDVFNGALAVGLAEGMTLKEAMLLASKAASISVTRMGAQSSAPFRHECESI